MFAQSLQRMRRREKERRELEMMVDIAWWPICLEGMEGGKGGVQQCLSHPPSNSLPSLSLSLSCPSSSYSSSSAPLSPPPPFPPPSPLGLSLNLKWVVSWSSPLQTARQTDFFFPFLPLAFWWSFSLSAAQAREAELQIFRLCAKKRGAAATTSTVNFRYSGVYEAKKIDYIDSITALLEKSFAHIERLYHIPKVDCTSRCTVALPTSGSRRHTRAKGCNRPWGKNWPFPPSSTSFYLRLPPSACRPHFPPSTCSSCLCRGRGKMTMWIYLNKSLTLDSKSRWKHRGERVTKRGGVSFVEWQCRAFSLSFSVSFSFSCHSHPKHVRPSSCLSLPLSPMLLSFPELPQDDGSTETLATACNSHYLTWNYLQSFIDGLSLFHISLKRYHFVLHMHSAILSTFEKDSSSNYASAMSHHSSTIAVRPPLPLSDTTPSPPPPLSLSGYPPAGFNESSSSFPLHIIPYQPTLSSTYSGPQVQSISNIVQSKTPLWQSCYDDQFCVFYTIIYLR